MGLTTIQEFVVDTLIEKQSITKEKLSNALDQILSSVGLINLHTEKSISADVKIRIYLTAIDI